MPKRNIVDNAIIKIGDGKLRFIDVNYSQPLTYKFICECLCDYFNNDDDIVMEIQEGNFNSCKGRYCDWCDYREFLCPEFN